MRTESSLFAGKRVPLPPPDLRERTLQAARAAGLAADVDAVRPVGRWNWWDVAWAGALLVLLACHVFLSAGDRPTAHVASRPATVASPRVPDDELGDVGVLLAARDEAPRGEPPLTVKRLVDDPNLGLF